MHIPYIYYFKAAEDSCLEKLGRYVSETYNKQSYGEEEVEELATISSMLSVLSPHIPLDLTGVDIVKLLQMILGHP